MLKTKTNGILATHSTATSVEVGWSRESCAGWDMQDRPLGEEARRDISDAARPPTCAQHTAAFRVMF